MMIDESLFTGELSESDAQQVLNFKVLQLAQKRSKWFEIFMTF